LISCKSGEYYSADQPETSRRVPLTLGEIEIVANSVLTRCSKRSSAERSATGVSRRIIKDDSAVRMRPGKLQEIITITREQDHFVFERKPKNFRIF